MTGQDNIDILIDFVSVLLIDKCKFKKEKLKTNQI